MTINVIDFEEVGQPSTNTCNTVYGQKEVIRRCNVW